MSFIGWHAYRKIDHTLDSMTPNTVSSLFYNHGKVDIVDQETLQSTCWRIQGGVKEN